MNDDQVEAYRAHIIKEMQESYTRLCMAYDCDCGARTYFVMDRFPMSYRIGFECESCKKFAFNKIVQPFVYYCKIFGEIEKADDIVFTEIENPQCMLLKQHMAFEKGRYRNKRPKTKKKVKT